jgi:hypothetical protein
LVANPNAPTIGRAGGAGRTRGDQNNNPGNLEYGRLAIAHGAIGSDGRFAIFPSLSAGTAAMDALLSTKGYSGLTLEQIQQRWVGYGHAGYLSGMEGATGVGRGGVPDMSSAEMRGRVMRGMALGEGTPLSSGTVGDVTHNNVNIGPTTITTQPGHTGAEAASNIMGTLRDQYSMWTRQLMPNTR